MQIRVVYNQAVRSFLAILQLLLLSLPTFASALATTQGGIEASLPACCRRMGTHHCILATAQTALELNGSRVSATPQPCPFAPKALPAAQHAPSSLIPSAIIFAQIVSHPACVAQTLAKRRISQDRSRQMRGPPALA